MLRIGITTMGTGPPNFTDTGNSRLLYFSPLPKLRHPLLSRLMENMENGKILMSLVYFWWWRNTPNNSSYFVDWQMLGTVCITTILNSNCRPRLSFDTTVRLCKFIRLDLQFLTLVEFERITTFFLYIVGLDR
jgi:hypothetical protein